VTHNRSHPSYNDFCRSVLHFLRVEVPKTGPSSEIRLPTISASSTLPIFGFWGVHSSYLLINAATLQPACE
jgi:hypothetical protein